MNANLNNTLIYMLIFLLSVGLGLVGNEIAEVQGQIDTLKTLITKQP